MRLLRFASKFGRNGGDVSILLRSILLIWLLRPLGHKFVQITGLHEFREDQYMAGAWRNVFELIIVNFYGNLSLFGIICLLNASCA